MSDTTTPSCIIKNGSALCNKPAPKCLKDKTGTFIRKSARGLICADCAKTLKENP